MGAVLSLVFLNIATIVTVILSAISANYAREKNTSKALLYSAVTSGTALLSFIIGLIILILLL